MEGRELLRDLKQKLSSVSSSLQRMKERGSGGGEGALVKRIARVPPRKIDEEEEEKIGVVKGGGRPPLFVPKPPQKLLSIYGPAVKEIDSESDISDLS